MLVFAVLTPLLCATDDAPKLDSATLTALRKRVAGKCAWDRRTGEVQVVYDFAPPKQGNDFVLDDKPVKVRGGMALDAAAEAVHLVPWQTVHVECVVSVAKVGGFLLKSEKSKVMLSVWEGPGGGNATIDVPGYAEGAILSKTEFEGFKTVRLELAEKWCAGSFAAHSIKRQDVSGPPGRVIFCGGKNGYAFRSVTFRGRPDPGWLKALVENKKT